MTDARSSARAAHVLCLLLGLGLGAGCDRRSGELAARAPPPESTLRVVRAPPREGHYRSAAELAAQAGTKARARERIEHDAEKAGCEVLVLTDEHADPVARDDGVMMTRYTIRGDCLKSDTAP